MPRAHVLQTWEWADFKHRATGWEPLRQAFYDDDEKLVALASTGIRRLGLFALMYAPRGPIFAGDDPAAFAPVLQQLMQSARQHRAIWLKVDPALATAYGVPGEDDDQPDENGQQFVRTLKELGWQFSGDQIQFRNTIMIDLTPDEDDILMQMSGNTRRKVRQAYKKDVTIRAATVDDLDLLYELYTTTSERDDFIIRPRDYYVGLWRELMAADMCHALIAEYDGQAIAHVILLHYGQTCWYFYGASSDAERQRMPNYALQWEAIKWAKSQGYTRYDMWGAPDEFNERDGMWGVYQFKRGFRGTVTRTVGAWDYAPYSPLYTAYTRLYPAVIGWLRRNRETETT